MTALDRRYEKVLEEAGWPWVRLIGRGRAPEYRKGFGKKAENDIAGQSVTIEWHVCFGDTSVQILRKLQDFMSETGHAPESFQTGKSEGARQMCSSSA